MAVPRPGSLPNRSPSPDSFSFERHALRRGILRIAGCDEAGRGPLAGPVVAAAVVLPPDCDYTLFRDSKTLAPRVRVELAAHLAEIGAAIGVGIVSAAEIDRLNILRASLHAMRLAVEDLAPPLPDELLVDGKFAVPLPLAQQTLIKGETKSASIAAASIVAKVTRDRIMDELHSRYPVYNFLRNKGYPTKEHRLALLEHGPTVEHRQTFRGVREHGR